MEKLLTVNEFAKIAQITKQGIYAQLEKKFKDYVVHQNGKIMIENRALVDLYGLTPELIAERQVKQETAFEQNRPTPDIDLLLQVKNEQIKGLQDTIKQQADVITLLREQNNRLTSLLAQSMEKIPAPISREPVDADSKPPEQEEAAADQQNPRKTRRTFREWFRDMMT